MGVTNNSTIKIKDVVDSGGIKTLQLTNIGNNQLLKDIDITKGRKGTGPITAGPLFHNVTLKNEYEDNHLVKFQDLDIAETYPITLTVKTPTTAFTGYTLYGFNVDVTYPNSTVKSHSINIRETIGDKNIEIEDCCDNAKVKVSASLFKDSGATISNTTTTYNADIAINPLFTEGNGVVCTGPLVYSCFTLTRSFSPIDPDEPVTPPVSAQTRKIDIYISTKNVSLYRLRIDTASYGTGSTLSEVQDTANPVTQVEISELTTEKSGLPISSMAVQATIEVPADAYVVIHLSDPKGSANVSTALAQYAWAENNYQYVSPGHKRTSVTYTISNFS